MHAAFRRGNWAEAIAYFEMALEYNPYDPVIMENLAAAREHLAQDSYAAEDERRRQAEADAEEERRIQAEAEEERRRQAEAEEERRRQAEAEAWELGRAMLYEGRWADAEYYLREYLRTNPGDPRR